MRKRNCNHFFDNLMWYLIYMLPLIAVVLACATGTYDLSILDTLNNLGIGILADNVTFTSLNSIFGEGGVLPLFANTEILYYFSYFISVFIVHLFVDFLLFIPRLCHKFMGKLTG